MYKDIQIEMVKYEIVRFYAFTGTRALDRTYIILKTAVRT